MFADLNIPYQVWVLVGLAFLVADLAAPGLILSCFGLGCLAGAAVSFVAPAISLTVQGGAALAGTIFAFLVIRPPLRRAQLRRKASKAETRTAKQRAPEPQEPAPGFFDQEPSAPRRPEPSPLDLGKSLSSEPEDDEPAPKAKTEEPRDPFAPKPQRKPSDPFAALTPPPAPKRPSAVLDMFEEDDERSGFDLLEPVLDDSLRLSIDEEHDSPLLLTDAVEETSRPQPALKDMDLSLTLDGGAPDKPRNPVGRTATALSPMGPFSAGQVELDGVIYKAFSDHNVKPGDKVAVLEQMPDHPEILVVEPRKGGL